MKCQHCGINFEDGERFCPICGERAGSKGRLSETGKPLFPHKTVRPRAEKKTERESVRSAIDPQYESVRTTAQHKTHSHEARPIGTKAVPSAMPKKSGRIKGNRKAGAIIAAAVVLVNFIPTIISLIEDSTANFPERLPDFVYDFTDGDSSHDYDNADTYIDLSILVGEQIELPLSDGATLALRDINIHRDPKRITPELIIDCVADYYGMSADMVRSDSRKKEIAQARHVAVYLTREMTSLSLPRIGDAFGRDHSTIINSCDKITKQLENQPDMKGTIADLKKMITEK